VHKKRSFILALFMPLCFLPSLHQGFKYIW